MVNWLCFEFFSFVPRSNDVISILLRIFSAISSKVQNILILEQRLFLFIAALNNEGYKLDHERPQ